jgi:DNA-binding response OmpR family regulator
MKKILAIDDEKAIRLILETSLKQKYNVTTKNDGEEGYNWMVKEKIIPDLIICDIQMPNLDGYEFLKRVRNSGFFGDVPIIMLSGEEQSKERVKCYQLKAQDYLTKPFNPGELIELIEKNLDSKIRVRNYRLNSGDRYYYYRIGALDFMPETGDMGEMEIKIKEKFLTRENF